MSTKTIVLANKFIKRASILEKTRSKMETVLGTGSINVADIEQVYAGLYLDIFTDFETMIEKLFVGLLSGQLYSQTQTVNRTAKIKPASMAQTILFNGKNYLDWLPFDSTLQRAKLYFTNGTPFDSLTKEDTSNLNDYYIIRNAIAHKSKIAQKKFQDSISSSTLLPPERSPSGYLRSKPHSSSNETQFQMIVLDLEGMSKRLCS